MMEFLKHSHARNLLVLGFFLLTLLWINISKISCIFGGLSQKASFSPTSSLKHLPFDSKVEEIQLNVVDLSDAKLPKVQVVPLWTTNDTLKYAVDNSEKYTILKQGLTPSSHLPSALIIGVKKGGTRALLEFLRVHPDIRAAGSEVHFFDNHYAKGFDWYRHRMPPTVEGQVTIEKTPSYFILPDVPRRVWVMNPGTKLIVVVRDPVTRAVSDYTQLCKHRKIPSFEEMAFINGSQIVDMNWIPLKIGIYSKYLELWLQYFPMGQLLFVSGEKLIANPAFEVGRAQDFLGLKRIISEKDFYFNSTKGFPCLIIRTKIHCLGKNKGRNHPRINPVAIQRLRDFYRPFNQKFYQLTGMDFSWT